MRLRPPRTMTVPRARLGAAAALAAPLILALSASGCGVSESVDPVAQAAEVTQSLPGARVIFTGEVVSPLAYRRIRFSGRGVLNNRPLAAHLRYHFPDLLAGPSRAPLSLELRILGHIAYYHFPALDPGIDEKRWIKIDEAKTAQAAGLGSLPSAYVLNPDQYLTYLRAVSGGFAALGGQKIHGVWTTGYRGEIELQRAARLAPPDRRSATIAAVDNLEHVTGIGAIPFEVWIDGQHRVRRMSLSEGESSSFPNAVKVYITVDFITFGHEPRTPAPAAGETYDASRAAARALAAELHTAK